MIKNLIISTLLLFQAGTLVDDKQIGFFFTNAPTITVTQVTSTTANSFPIPSGKSTCIVTRNIAQSQGIDYTVQGTSPAVVIFNQAPIVGDVVQLNCW
jgi:hypothetical protein